ncbi:MAG: flagellar basal body protein FliL [Rhodovulum sp.]|mgnify:CR=1 FL=1|jgi:flagellar protein FliL|nr:flagellar basal body protein FliL [Rhodovulum sp.]|tara:strand:+ start:903 stop:1382 length:480 start_codon:yes stop_codon:yes gene_type:complete
MAEDIEENEEDTPKGGKKGLLIGLVLAVVLGGGGFYAAFSGLLPIGASAAHAPAPSHDMNEVAFVALDPLVISLGPERGNRHLKFAAQLEVEPHATASVSHLKPRVLDVLNSYLRAVSINELEDPSSLIRLRAQMLRRIQIVTGEGQVRDLLVTEFVLN